MSIKTNITYVNIGYILVKTKKHLKFTDITA